MSLDLDTRSRDAFVTAACWHGLLDIDAVPRTYKEFTIKRLDEYDIGYPGNMAAAALDHLWIRFGDGSEFHYYRLLWGWGCMGPEDADADEGVSYFTDRREAEMALKVFVTPHLRRL